jgi:hypothetical protein
LENSLPRAGHYFLRYYLLLLLLFAGYRALELHPRFYRSVLWSDSEGYYLYLPALFINGGFEDLPVRTEEQFPMYEETNKRFTKYTCGLAMMELPFFLGAHGLTLATGGEADGYSRYYVRALQLAALVYGFLGLLLLKRLLEKHFSRGVTFLTIVGLFLGTNLYHYVIQEPSMSHVYSFFLFACFVWLTPTFYRQPGWKLFALMGGLLGLIVLIRPTNILIVLYLLLYGIRSRAEAAGRLRFIGRHFKALLVAPVASFIVFIPQFWYWKYISGDWLIYSYGEEGFNWLNPRIDMVLFHVKNGWLYYSPMAGLSILGCLLGCWKNRYNIAPIFLIWALLLYITSSWWNWWFGGAFGHRNFVEYYLLLAFSYAWLFTQVLESRWTPPKIILLALWVFLLYYGYMLAVYYPGGLYEEWSLEVAWEHMWDFDFSTHYEK